MTVTNRTALCTVSRESAARAIQQVLDHLNMHCRNFVARSSFCISLGLVVLTPLLLRLSPAWANDLFLPVAPRALPAGPPAEATLRSRAVAIDVAHLHEIHTALAQSQAPPAHLPGYAAAPPPAQSSPPVPGTTLRVHLFDGRVVTGVIEHTAPTFSGGYSLTGRIVEDPRGRLVLVINGETVAGMVHLSDGTYRLRSVDGEVVALSEERQMPPVCHMGNRAEEEPALLPVPPPAPGGHPLPVFPARQSSRVGPQTPVAIKPEPHSLITIAIFYTPKARDTWGGTDQVKAIADSHIAYANQFYKDNGIHQTLKLVALQEANYTEVGKSTDIIHLVEPNDGHIDEIHHIRNRVHADLALLWTDGDGGIASTVPKYTSKEWLEWNADNLFAVYDGDLGVMLHEIGHLMGAAHDRYQQGCESGVGCDTFAAYPYAYGYVNLKAFEPGAPKSSHWFTIMAYPDLCDDNGIFCLSLWDFSNPRRTYKGDPLGVDASSTATGRDGPADAVRAFNNTRTFVADFRSGPRVGNLENPSPDSPQSGIGLVSGWVCDAGEVTVEFDLADGSTLRLPAATGTLRSDTVGVCGHDKTGFGLLWNWNNLGDGTHTVRAYADEHLLGESDFTVTTLGLGPFPRGLRGAYRLQGFPEAGTSTPVEWSQTRQNFVIAAQRGAVDNPGAIRDGSQGVMGNPGPGSAHSGVAIISGWHCTAESVKIELINGTTGQVISTQAGAGTERSDTAGVCGDSDNGFGLLWNWNLLGAGWHTVRAFADEETEAFSWSTVFVTTLGEEFARGLRGEFELADFPAAGQTVTIEWRQEQQNFVITRVE